MKICIRTMVLWVVAIYTMWLLRALTGSAEMSERHSESTFLIGAVFDFCLTDLVVFRFCIGPFVMYTMHFYSAVDEERFHRHEGDECCSLLSFDMIK